MKILFVSRKYHQTVGGVERMSIEIMNAMIARGHDVHLLSWDTKDAVAFYQIHRQINWHKLDIGDASIKATAKIKIQRALKAREIVKKIKPDVIIAFQDGAYQSISAYCTGLKIPIIAAERNAPSRFDFLKAGKRRHLIFQSFRLAKAITVQCKSYVEHYPKYLRSKISVIPNPVKPSTKVASPAKGKPLILLSVGRLDYQKNYKVLIHAFAKIADKFPSWKLEIVGGGGQEEELRYLIKELNLSQKVILIGETNNVQKHYVASHLFCLPSLWEGFPNALGEAMAHGLPSVGFEECSGVSDLITNNENGLLASGNNNVESFSESLAILMENDMLRIEMGKAARKSIKQFEPEDVFNQWERLFKSIAQT